MAKKSNLEKLLIDGSSKFTAKMFYEVAKSNANQNLVLSAFAVISPLAQIALASVDESHKEILDAIGMPNENITKEVFSFGNSKFHSIKGITLKIANKIYVAKNYKIKDDFAAVSREIFGSEIKNIDFMQQQKAADEVNAWVESQTNHRIKNLVVPEKLTKYTRTLLVNAIYFKGNWENPFNEDTTRNDNFFVTKDEIIKVPTMYKRCHYKYSKNKKLDAQILEMYYKGKESSFVIVLPRQVEGINVLEKKLKDPTILDKALNALEETEVDVYIPKFKIETTTNLKEILEKMNITKMFTSGLAKLVNLVKDNDDLYVDAAVQKAFIEVNEEGAEAAAANTFCAATSFNRFKKLPKQFQANRPFYFAIRTNSLTLFNGVLRKP